MLYRRCRHSMMTSKNFFNSAADRTSGGAEQFRVGLSASVGGSTKGRPYSVQRDRCFWAESSKEAATVCQNTCLN
jgi:hypothetical protein